MPLANAVTIVSSTTNADSFWVLLGGALQVMEMLAARQYGLQVMARPRQRGNLCRMRRVCERALAIACTATIACLVKECSGGSGGGRRIAHASEMGSRMCP